MKHVKLAAFAATAAFVVSGLAYGADLARKDKQFFEKANEAGQLEIAASRLAEQRSSNPEVKAFAQMMVADHTKVADELKTLASSKQVTLPADMSKKVRSKVDSLGKKSGADFDKEYADDIGVDAHEDAVDLFKDTAKDSKDADIQAFAQKTLPSLQMHLQKGSALKAGMKKKN